MKLSTYKGVPEKVFPIVAPIVEAEGLRLWDIEFYKEHRELLQLGNYYRLDSEAKVVHYAMVGKGFDCE